MRSLLTHVGVKSKKSRNWRKQINLDFNRHLVHTKIIHINFCTVRIVKNLVILQCGINVILVIKLGVFASPLKKLPMALGMRLFSLLCRATTMGAQANLSNRSC